ncbi:hypothetical protein Gogos_022123 [Gossypium gossypioides]|uniref:Uncharacterized protein n=1 Tax=Gossypium gossypioides TaxID=34282 RepID=A0A7J9CWP0_GOSGO|nr:hypothetical protein [Gossypium gossypioides]
MFPIVWAMVEVECTDSEWEELCATLEKKDKDAYDNLMRKTPKIWT